MTKEEALEFVYYLASGTGLAVSSGFDSGFANEKSADKARKELDEAIKVLMANLEITDDSFM